MPAQNTTPSNKNWLLIQFRKWHSWGGLFLSAFILLVAATGIGLNHKDLLFHNGEKKANGALRSTSDIDAIPISFSRALTLAREHYGDVALEKIELKDENGQLVYKIGRGGGDEIRVDARSGAIFSKYGMALGKDPQSRLNWAKIVDDLHTGKIFGTLGKLLIDGTSVVIIALTVTGIYLWAVPLVRKRQTASRRKSVAPASIRSTNPQSLTEDLAGAAVSHPAVATNQILALARRNEAPTQRR